jgi:hypothetical protein
LRLHHLCLVLLLLCLPLPAWADAYEALFAGGQSPALLNPRLAERTTVLCKDAYAVLASGVTHGPLWSAEHLTASGLREAEAMARVGHFHEEDCMPPRTAPACWTTPAPAIIAGTWHRPATCRTRRRSSRAFPWPMLCRKRRS